MDIKRMHCMIEKLSECAKSEMESGIENVDTCEMGKVVDMMKDLSEAMYYRTLTKAMDEQTWRKRLKCLSVTETEEDFMTNTDTLTEDLLRKDVERTVEDMTNHTTI